MNKQNQVKKIVLKEGSNSSNTDNLRSCSTQLKQYSNSSNEEQYPSIDKHKTIYAVSGDCGSGKTTAARNMALSQVQKDGTERFIFCFPTLQVIDEQIKQFGNSDLVLAITSNTTDNPVDELVTFSKKLQMFGKGIKPKERILLITHKSFERLEHFVNKEEWHIIYDEVNQTLISDEINLTDNKNVLRDTLDVIQDPNNDEFYIVKLKHQSSITSGISGEHIAKNKPAKDGSVDDFWKALECVYRRLDTNQTGARFDVRIRKEQWDNLETTKFLFTTTILPTLFDGYKSVTLMAAHIENTEMYSIWGKLGVRFKASNNIKPAFPKHRENVCKNIRIINLEKSLSKSSRDQYSKENKVDVFAKYKQTILDIVKDEPVLVVKNNDVKGECFEGLKYKICPVKAEGINSFRDFKNIICFTALNKPSHFISVMTDLYEINQKHDKFLNATNTIYQAVCRTAIRNPDNNEMVRVFLFDTHIANEIAKFFPGCYLDDPFKNTTEHYFSNTPVMTSAERMKKTRDRVRQEIDHQRQMDLFKSMDLSEVDFGTQVNWDEIFTPKTANHPLKQVAIDPFNMGHRNLNRGVMAPIFSVETHTGAQSIISVRYNSVEEFFFHMQEASKCPIAKKEDQPLICSSLFREGSFYIKTAKTKDKKRSYKIWSKSLKSKELAIATNGIWFDIDDGVMTPQQASGYFKEYKHFVCNSFNNGNNGKMKYRLFIATSGFFSLELYRDIWDILVKRISNDYFVGYPHKYEQHKLLSKSPKQFSGVDVSKKSGENWFHIPSLAGIPEHSFFFENEGKLLDPKDFISKIKAKGVEYQYTPYSNPEPERKLNTLTDIKNKLLEENKAEDYKKKRIEKLFSSYPNNPGSHTGHNNFMYFAAALNGIEEDDWKYRDLLNDWASGVDERVQEIQGIIRYHNR